jgi:hypothetical protein
MPLLRAAAAQARAEDRARRGRLLPAADPQGRPGPTLGRLRTNEIPGIRGDDLQRPYVTIALVLLGAIGYLVLAFLDRGDLAIVGPLETDWWRALTAPFVYGDVWYQLPRS